MKRLLVRSSWFGVIFLFLITALTFILPTTNYQLPTTFAAITPGCETPPGSDLPRVTGGLVSTPSLGSGTQFYTSEGKCVVNDATVFVPFKIPTVNDLKSLYFTQKNSSTITKTTITPISSPGATQTDIPFNSATGYNIYNITGSFNNLVLSGNNQDGNNPNGNTGVVFVDGYLNITSNYTYGGANDGAVFIVSGNIYIESDVTTIDAVLIAGGRIYTATTVGTINPCVASAVSVPTKLTVNGSLISLTQSSPIVFCRNLLSTNNTEAAEIIFHQPKYLVLLRNTVAQTLQKWTEIQ